MLQKKKAVKKQVTKVKAVEAAAPAEPEKATGYIGKELTIQLNAETEFKGVCTGERLTNSGAQVFLKLNGCVSRWFSAQDIKK